MDKKRISTGWGSGRKGARDLDELQVPLEMWSATRKDDDRAYQYENLQESGLIALAKYRPRVCRAHVVRFKIV